MLYKDNHEYLDVKIYYALCSSWLRIEPVDFLFVVPVNVEDKSAAIFACCYLRETTDHIHSRVHVCFVFHGCYAAYFAHFQMYLQSYMAHTVLM